MVTFSAEIQIAQLKQKAQYLGYTKISWENYINKKRITQCHRCQEWGHATANCYAEPICLKCAGKHWTRDCTKTKDTPAKCVNCEGGHPANATICQVYQRRLKMLTTKNTPTARTRQTSVNTNINIKDHTQFPSLETKASPLVNVWKHRSEHADLVNTINKATNPVSNESTLVKNSSNQYTEFIELSREIKQINQICNINTMLKIVKEMRIRLQQCHTKIEKFQVFVDFATKLETD
ncbi:hypothetical protein KPH14_012661 [Odynerus spinipes]|uniref:Gag-like protein n=1 Tax=Odynerus spinipes TaxID=1348599 RepID=A0AAD9RFW5_9HYME|nr:hypothetical protein KPH14_012661 [Odynerus spinipes]